MRLADHWIPFYFTEQSRLHKSSNQASSTTENLSLQLKRASLLQQHCFNCYVKLLLSTVCEFEMNGPEGYVDSTQIAKEGRAQQTEAVDCRWYIRAPPRAKVCILCAISFFLIYTISATHRWNLTLLETSDTWNCDD